MSETEATEWDGASLVDYKVHVFNAGKPIVLVCADRAEGRLPKKSYYDAGCNPIDLREGDREPYPCPRPARLAEILERSRELAAGFNFVRMDWYETSGRLYFGEMTFTPANGAKHFVSPEWNAKFGRRIRLGAGSPLAGAVA